MSELRGKERADSVLHGVPRVKNQRYRRQNFPTLTHRMQQFSVALAG